MVYCGKPSKACHACRKRKTRCDARAGGCTQCKNAGRSCPGYRSRLDLVFRDQSQDVINKAKAREAKGLANETVIMEMDSASPSNQTSVLTERDVAVICPDSISNRAKCFFMYNFAGGMTFPGLEGIVSASETSSGVLNSLYAMPNLDIVLDASLRATSLACYANYTRSQRLKELSYQSYIKALQLTNKALRSEADVKKDSTLLSVNLLGLYEMFSGRSKHSMKDWAVHIKGAAALLQLRGTEQFQTSIGLRMFLQTICSMLACSLQWNLRLPDSIVGMTKFLIKEMHHGGWQARLFEAMLDFNQFRYDVRRSRSVVNPQDIINRALRIDDAIAEISDTTVTAWRYETVTDKDMDQDVVYNGRYHIYPQHNEASLWNSSRIYRILIHEQIRQALSQKLAANPPGLHSQEHALQFQHSTDMCRALAVNILASVPQQLGFLGLSDCLNRGNRKESYQGSTQLAPQNALDANPTSPADFQSAFSSLSNLNERVSLIQDSTQSRGQPFVIGLSLLWPIWIAGVMPTATTDMRAYSIKMLEYMGVEMGLSHALVFADLLKTRTPDNFPIWTNNTKPMDD